MVRKVAIVGFGSMDNSPEARRKDDLRSWRYKIAEAGHDILASVDKGMDPKDIQYIVTNYHGEATVEGGSPAEIVDALGMVPTGHSLITDQCTGSGTSFHDAWALVASGQYDRVLHIGWDSRYDLLNRADKRCLQSNVDYDYHLGFDHFHTTDMANYFNYKYYGKRQVLEATLQNVILRYWYANRNPKAGLYGVPCPIKKEEMLALLDKDEKEFLRRLPRGLATDGASGVVMVPAEDARKYTDTPVYVEGVAQKNTPNYPGWPMHYPLKEYDWMKVTNTPPDKFDFLCSPALWLSTKEAMKRAKIEPKDIDIAEPPFPDIFMFIEAMGICPRHGAAKFIIDGETAIDGRLPMCTHGGADGFGKASGADWSNGLVEAVIQLRGQAGERQAPKAEVCICQGVGGVGGMGAMSATAVLRRG